MVIDAELKLRDHTYRLNWIVFDCRYDIMLGMLLHVECQPTINYEKGKFRVEGTALPSSRDSGQAVCVHNLCVEKFRYLLSKKKKNSEEFFNH